MTAERRATGTGLVFSVIHGFLSIGVGSSFLYTHGLRVDCLVMSPEVAWHCPSPCGLKEKCFCSWWQVCILSRFYVLVLLSFTRKRTLMFLWTYLSFLEFCLFGSWFSSRLKTVWWLLMTWESVLQHVDSGVVPKTTHVLCPFFFSFLFFKKLFYFVMYMDILPACLSVHVCLVPRDAKRGQRAWGPTELEFQWLWAAMWVLGLRPRSLKEQPVLLTSKPSLKLLFFIF